ncbi:MAG: hypothetical protein ACRDRU_21705 [Pseudonocardiaceae bacterium]
MPTRSTPTRSTRARSAGSPRGILDAEQVLRTYSDALARQPLAGRTREAYLAQVSSFVAWLGGSEHGAAALSEPRVRDCAVRDYKRHVKTSRKWSPATVNQAWPRSTTCTAH